MFDDPQYFPEPQEAPPYSTYTDTLPSRIHPAYSGFAYQAMDHASTDAPHTIRSMVALPGRDWETISSSLTIHAFGTFRSHVRTIIGLAEVLAAVYLTHLILPVIRPITRPEWQALYRLDRPPFTDIASSGLLFYSAIRD